MRKLNKAGEKIKFQILELLSNPMTASDLKEKLPGVSSMGTILYHLKNLVEEGKLVKEKQTKVRGQPTYYYLAYLKKMGINSWRDLEDIQDNERKKLLLELIQNFKEGMLLKDLDEIGQRLSKKYENLRFAGDEHYDLIVNENYFELYLRLTEKGKKFLEENSSNQKPKRKDFNPMELAEGLSRRKELYEALHPETKVGSGTARGITKEHLSQSDNRLAVDRFTQDTAKKIGKSETFVKEHLQLNDIKEEDKQKVRNNKLKKSEEFLQESSYKIKPKRKDFNPMELAEGLSRRKELYEALHPETKHGAIGGGHDRSRVSDSDNLVNRFTQDTAKKIGKSETFVKEHLQLNDLREEYYYFYN